MKPKECIRARCCNLAKRHVDREWICLDTKQEIRDIVSCIVIDVHETERVPHQQFKWMFA